MFGVSIVMKRPWSELGATFKTWKCKRAFPWYAPKLACPATHQRRQRQKSAMVQPKRVETVERVVEEEGDHGMDVVVGGMHERMEGALL
jgi:hypothetical protein